MPTAIEGIKLLDPSHIVNLSDYNPKESSTKLSRKDCPKDAFERKYKKRNPYQSAVGSLVWVMVCASPNLAFAASTVAKSMSDPGPNHRTSVKRVFWYIQGTTSEGLYHSTVNQLALLFHCMATPMLIGAGI